MAIAPSLRDDLVIGLHLLINILSTTILSSSNYCAQFLGALRREDVDRAHFRGSWLDIGIPSVRNIRALGFKRKLLWGILFITTIPVHAMFVFRPQVGITPWSLRPRAQMSTIFS